MWVYCQILGLLRKNCNVKMNRPKPKKIHCNLLQTKENELKDLTWCEHILSFFLFFCQPRACVD